jgi:hypothetical protein
LHSPFIWRRNPTKTLGLLLPWISPWFFVGVLLSPPPYAQSFLRKPSFLVLADFFPWFLKSKQQLSFLGVVYLMKQEGVCTDEFLSRKPGFLLSAMHSHAFCWFSAAPLVF